MKVPPAADRAGVGLPLVGLTAVTGGVRSGQEGIGLDRGAESGVVFPAAIGRRGVEAVGRAADNAGEIERDRPAVWPEVVVRRQLTVAGYGLPRAARPADTE